ncbi:MAG: hypothetical protein FJ146_05850 [Deltaproteobacteria bacterium]|nr:hypothetical protein [Deltaproteobacteria bacterium]
MTLWRSIANWVVPIGIAVLSVSCSGGSSGGSGLTGKATTFAGDVQVPKSAVSKGSFTVWAEPENPEPRQEYVIYTKIKLPAGTTAYDMDDLNGNLTGTDGFAIPLGGQRNAFCTFTFSPKRNTATMTTQVPGAKSSGIRDTITIESRLLAEEQQIELVFGQIGVRLVQSHGD